MTSTPTYPATVPRDFWSPLHCPYLGFLCRHQPRSLPPPGEQGEALQTRTPPAGRRPALSRDFAFTDPMTHIIQDETPRKKWNVKNLAFGHLIV